MKRTLFKLLLLCNTVFVFSGCNFISDTITYKNNSKAFVNDLLTKNYNDCLKLIMYNKDQNKDSLNILFDHLRTGIVENFGEKPEITFMESERTYEMIGDSKIKNDTMVLNMQISNGKEFGVLKFSYLLEDKKIVHFNIKKYNVPVPSLTVWWLLFILALSLPVFNIYMIVRVKRSNLTRKWLYYISIILVNVTSIGYHVLFGFFFNIESFQPLAGFGFAKEGFINTYVVVGIPVGALFALWQLKRKQPSNPPEEIQPEDIGDVPEEEYTV